MHINEDYYFESLEDGSDERTIKRSLDVRESTWYDLIALGDFEVPEYQRNYSWESTETGDGNERDEFWRTLEDNFEDLKQVPSYIVEEDDPPPQDSAAGLYMGALYISESADTEYDVVDGQQRLVSFQLLIGALLENLSVIKTQLEEEGKGGEYIDLIQGVENCEEDLTDAYHDGFASLSLNKEDKEFFKMLAAQPTRTSMNAEVIDYLKKRVEIDEDIDGQNKPRAIQAKNLVGYLNGDPAETHGDLRASSPQDDELCGLNGNALSVETIENNVLEKLETEGDDEESDVLSTYIRFFESHAKLLNCYLEAYSFVEAIKQEHGQNQLEKEANTLINLTYFVLYAIIVSVIEITSSSTDVGLEIFESINDRGKELNDVDKIRARIKYVLDEEADSGVMDNWQKTLDRFGGDKSEIKDMLTYYVGATDDNVDDVSEADDALMEVFNNHSEDYTARLRNRDTARELVQDIYEFSEYYYYICDNNMAEESRLHLDDRPDLPNKKITQIDWIVTRLNNLGFTQWFVLGPRMCQKIDKTDEDDFDDETKSEFLLKVFDAIEVIAMRQSTSGKSGEATEGVYTTAVQNLPNPEEDGGAPNYDSSDTVSQMAEDLINQTPNLFGSGLISNITEQKAWHTYSSSTISKGLMTRMVNANRNEEKFGGEMFQEDDDLTIEHVLPDTPVSDNVKSKRDEDIDPHEWFRIFFKLDELDDPDTDAVPRIAADISEYIVEGGVMTTNQSTYRAAAQFVSQLESSGFAELSEETLEVARDAIDSADNTEVDNELVETALEFESIDDIGDVKEEVTNTLSALDMDRYDTDNSAGEITRLLEEINERFIDDISNLFFLSFSDNPVASNNLLSEKLTVLSDDDYDTIVVNEFFQPDGEITEMDNELSEEDLNAFNDEEVDISNEIAHRADYAWDYEAAFERKADLIKIIVTYLKFDINPGHQRYGKNEFTFGGESLEDKISTEVKRDKARRLQRDNF